MTFLALTAMFLLNFYRFYAALTLSVLAYVALRRVWVSVLVLAAARTAWFCIERALENSRITRLFNRHNGAFRQEFGPYGIRIANKAEEDSRIRRSLVEVFEPDLKKLRKNVDQLDVMDALFKAGLRPEGDEYLLHDLKLKYGKLRLERERDKAAETQSPTANATPA